MAREGALKFPVIAVNDTPMKHYFDNVHGTGESALTAIMVTTNVLIAGKHVVVAGYGYCGRGLARKLHGLGARVIVTEIDPRRALEAYMDGFTIMPMDKAAAIRGDIYHDVREHSYHCRTALQCNERRGNSCECRSFQR